MPSDDERGADSERPGDVADSTSKEPPARSHGRPRPVADTQGPRHALPSLEEALLGLRLLAGVPAFLRRPIRPAGAAAVVRARLATREASFLALMARAVYGEPSSPYRELLAWAGCQHGDLVRLVRQGGVEGALRALFRAGVYLSLDELKGRVPAVRGRITVTAGLSRLRNPLAAGQLAVHTSGSRGPRTDAVIDLRSIRDQAIDVGLALAARGGAGWTKAIWGVPGSVAIVRLLDLSLFEPRRPVRWFAQVDPAAPGLHPRYRWSLRALRWGSWMGARPLPAPTFAPLDDPSPVLQWLQEVRQRRETPLLWTHASPAVRLSEAARQAGVSLDGVELSVGGEPLTPGRLAAIQASGARAVPHYASMEAG